MTDSPASAVTDVVALCREFIKNEEGDGSCGMTATEYTRRLDTLAGMTITTPAELKAMAQAQAAYWGDSPADDAPFAQAIVEAILSGVAAT